jgi:hypothetical protein
MTYCDNRRCRHCFIDVENMRTLICVADPIFITVPEARVFIRKCNTYLKRDDGDSCQPLDPIGADGLYPGQLKTPKDYSDFDPEEHGHIPKPVQDKAYRDLMEKGSDTHVTGQEQEYITEEECDT